jgi:hypothetical protein
MNCALNKIARIGPQSASAGIRWRSVRPLRRHDQWLMIAFTQ